MDAKIESARDFATSAHEGQYRSCGEKYINHPKRVVQTLIDLKVSDEDVLSAAWLHDVVEDCNVSLDQIRNDFGWRVAALVDELTLTLPDRKASDISYKDFYKLKTHALVGKAVFMSMEGKIIKLSDRLDNLTSSRNSWQLDEQFQYALQAKDMIVGMDVCVPMLDRHVDVYKTLKSQVESLSGTIIKEFTNR